MESTTCCDDVFIALMQFLASTGGLVRVLTSHRALTTMAQHFLAFDDIHVKKIAMLPPRRIVTLLDKNTSLQKPPLLRILIAQLFSKAEGQHGQHVTFRESNALVSLLFALLKHFPMVFLGTPLLSHRLFLLTRKLDIYHVYKEELEAVATLDVKRQW